MDNINVTADVQAVLKEKPILATAVEISDCRRRNRNIILLICGIFLLIGVLTWFGEYVKELQSNVGIVWSAISFILMTVLLIINSYRFSTDNTIYKFRAYCIYQEFGKLTEETDVYLYEYRREPFAYFNGKFIYYDYIRGCNRLFYTLPNGLMLRKELEHSNYIYLYGVEKNNGLKIYYDFGMELTHN